MGYQIQMLPTKEIHSRANCDIVSEHCMKLTVETLHLFSCTAFVQIYIFVFLNFIVSAVR